MEASHDPGRAGGPDLKQVFELSNCDVKQNVIQQHIRCICGTHCTAVSPVGRTCPDVKSSFSLCRL